MGKLLAAASPNRFPVQKFELEPNSKKPTDFRKLKNERSTPSDRKGGELFRG